MHQTTKAALLSSAATAIIMLAGMKLLHPTHAEATVAGLEKFLVTETMCATFDHSFPVPKGLLDSPRIGLAFTDRMGTLSIESSHFERYPKPTKDRSYILVYEAEMLPQSHGTHNLVTLDSIASCSVTNVADWQYRHQK